MVKKHLKALQNQKDTEDFAGALCGCVEQVHFIKTHPLILCKHNASTLLKVPRILYTAQAQFVSWFPGDFGSWLHDVPNIFFLID